MPDFKIHHYDVPEGFPPMSLPTREDTRLSKDKIKLVYCKESDLEEWCALCYEAFPNLFWDMVEDPKDRPSLPERIKLMSKHFKPWLDQPGYHAIKAIHADTGEMLGIAGWHESGTHAIYPRQYDALPGLTFPDTYVPCVWRDDLAVALGQAKRVGLTDAELAEMESYHTPDHAKLFLDYDRGRLGELKDRPHWYLAPLAVWPKWNGRGVGRELLDWGISRADERGWPTILEALPNARPVYYHLGFESTRSHGEFKQEQLVRPARTR